MRFVYNAALEPHPAIIEPATRRKARLLSSLLLFVILQAIPATLWVVFSQRAEDPFANPFIYVALPTVLTFILAYVLSRTARYELGSAITVLLLPVFTFASALTTDVELVSQAELLVWLLLAVLISSMFFPIRVTASLAIANLVALMALPYVAKSVTGADVLVPTIFNGIMSTVMLVAARHRNLVEEDRRQALAESEVRYRTLLENVFDGIIFHDNENILQANSGFARMFGYEADEVAGMNLGEFALENQPNRLIAQAIESGARRTHEVKAVRKGGETFDVEVVGKPQPYFGRTIQMAAVRDISERKRATEAEYGRRVMAESLRDTAAALNSTLDLDKVLERILTNVNRVVPHNAASVIIVDEEEGHVNRARGYSRQKPRGEYSFELAEIPYLQEMLQTAEPLLINDTRSFDGWVDIFETGWHGSQLSTPILIEGEVIGFLNLESQQPNFFNESQADDLKTFADQAAIAIVNARLYRQLQDWNAALESAVQMRTVELQRTKEQLEVILNNSPETILLLDLDGVVITANHALVRNFGYQTAEVRGRGLRSFAAVANEAAVATALRKAAALGEPEHIEFLARKQSGDFFDADLFISPITYEGQTINLVASIRDISSLKEVERMKDAFVSNVSHELRTPITSLKLQQGLLQLKPEDRERISARMEREIERLQFIIDDLLNLSRLEQNRVPFEFRELSLDDLVQEYTQDRAALAEVNGLTLSSEIDPECTLPPVKADPGLMGQVLSILLNNAINYTPKGGAITVATHAQARPEGDGVAFSVIDSGPGIPESDANHIFERFYRGEVGRNSGAPGTGLGLAIAKEIVERHGGVISVANVGGGNGSGAQFEVWLPAAEKKGEAR